MSREMVHEFCQKNGIAAALKTAIHLAFKSFPSLRKLSLAIETDPESEELTQKVVLFVTAECSSATALANYQEYQRELNEAVEPEARSWFSLCYDRYWFDCFPY